MRPPELELLREVLTLRNLALLPLLDQLDFVPLAAAQRDALREAVANELGETGVDANGAMNTRGALLDDLIDRLGHL